MEVSVLREKENNVKKSNEIRDDALEALARCLYPAIRSYFESEEGRREFDEWKSRGGIEAPSATTGAEPLQEAG